jgi:hypothetical protein
MQESDYRQLLMVTEQSQLVSEKTAEGKAGGVFHGISTAVCTEDGGASNAGSCDGVPGRTAPNEVGSSRFRNDVAAGGRGGGVAENGAFIEVCGPVDERCNALTYGVLRSACRDDGSGDRVEQGLVFQYALVLARKPS